MSLEVLDDDCFVSVFGVGWDLTSNDAFRRAVATVQEQMLQMDLQDASWTPVQVRSVCLVAILANEACSKQKVIIQTGGYNPSFRISLAGSLDDFDYDSYQSAADLCNAEGMAACVLAIVATRFKLHCNLSWTLATKFQQSNSHTYFEGFRLALLEESLKVFAYWVMLLDSDSEDDHFEEVRLAMLDHWFSADSSCQETLECRALFLSSGYKKESVVSIADTVSTLFLSGIANLLVAHSSTQPKNKKRKKNVDRFDVYLKIVRALGFECDESNFRDKKLTMRDAKESGLTDAECQYIYVRLGFSYMKTGASPPRHGMMPPGVKADPMSRGALKGLRAILATLKENLK